MVRNDVDVPIAIYNVIFEWFIRTSVSSSRRTKFRKNYPAVKYFDLEIYSKKAPTVGLEPTTTRLRVLRSTI